MWRTRGYGDQLPPERRGIVPAARPTAEHGESSRRVTSDASPSVSERALIGLLRPKRQPAPRVQLPQRQRFTRIASGAGTASDQVEEPRRQPGQRQQVQAVMPEDPGQMGGVTLVNECEVA